MGNHAYHRLVLTVLTGLLAGCPTVDLGDTPTDIGLCNPAGGVDYFSAEVWPRFIRHGSANACTQAGGCHAEGGGNALNFKTAEPIDFAANFKQAQVFLNCGSPDMSDLLTKPLAGRNPHGGSDLFASESDDGVVAFLGWF